MGVAGDLTILNGKLTILMAFGHGAKVDKSQLIKFIGSDVITERWNKPIEVKYSESTAVIVAGSDKITCSVNIYADVFIAGVTVLRTEIELKDRYYSKIYLLRFNPTQLL